jgi:hypothetical protein
MISDCQYLVSRMLTGEKVIIEDVNSPWEAGAHLIKDRELQYQAEARNGLMGWLMGNWPTICSITCNCGSGLISYDAVRASGELICNSCFKLNSEQ